MKKGIIFLLLLAGFAVSFVFLLRMGSSTNDWRLWVVLIVLPVVGWVAAKTNFTTDD